MFKLHQGSIRSSPGDGLNTPCRLTKIQCWPVTVGLLHNVLIFMGELHLVLPATILSTLDAGILIMVQPVRLMMFSLNMMNYSISFLSLSIRGFDQHLEL